MRLSPHPFTLRQLQYVVAVAEELSFRRAAERCSVSQPSLSSQLALLEEVIGFRLFERDKRRVLPTQAGQEFVERARRLLVDGDELVQVARRATDPLRGSLKIGVIPTIAPYLLPTITPALRRKFQHLSIVWLEDKTEVLVGKLERAELDAAVLALEADIGEVSRAILLNDPFVLATRADDPLAGSQAPVKLRELNDADVLLLADGHCFRDQALPYCARAKTREAEFRATSMSTLVQMVAGGLGVTLLPQLAVETERRLAKLSIRPLGPPAPKRTIALVWRQGAAIGEALGQLAAVMREALERKAVKLRARS